MWVLSGGGQPRRSGRRRHAIAALIVIVPLTGCASHSAEAPSNWPGEPATRVAGYTAQGNQRIRRAEMESDGQEGQPAPYVRDVRVPDDPTQPYSPNYGRSRLAPDPVPAGVDLSSIPDDLPADFRDKLVAALN